MGKLFVRERRNIDKGTATPRFEIVAASGADLQVYHSRLRRLELEKIAAEIGAEIIDLPRGESGEKGEEMGGKKTGKGHRRHEDND